MRIELMHPRDQIYSMMRRIYGYGMTTTSGGNLSVKDDDGSIWISPGGTDKGALEPEDVVQVLPDGTVLGRHRPSVEYPFHRAIYQSRPDVKAVVHAHPPALVSFAVVRELPDTSILPKSRIVCGEVGYSDYAIPGSEQLGKNIAGSFAKGFNTVLLENHGVACAGENLLQAFERFETLDFSARLIIKARQIGKPRSLSQEQLEFIKGDSHLLPEFEPESRSSRELELRTRMLKFIRRAYDQMIISSTEGTFSARIDDNSFVITPYGMDRLGLESGDLVLISKGRREQGKIPSRSVKLHEAIYRQNSEINAVMIAHPTNIMAFGVAGVPFNSKTIPESYILLRDIPVFQYGTQYRDTDTVVSSLSAETPMAIIENDCLISCGKDLLQAFDRLEVAEYSARAVIYAHHLGELKPISEEEVAAIEKEFF